MADDYINRSDHAVSLASGAVLAPGDRGESDMKDPHDKALRTDGALIKAEKAEKEKR
jgi:hypothetical protein